jgi:hypothetical protein
LKEDQLVEGEMFLRELIMTQNIPSISGIFPASKEIARVFKET